MKGGQPEAKGLSLVDLLIPGARKDVGQTATAVRWLLEDPSLVEQLVFCLLQPDPALCARAGRVLKRISARRSAVFQPIWDRLLGDVAASPHWEVRAQLCESLPRLNLTEPYRERALALCFQWLEDRSSIVRTCAMQALADFASLDRELRFQVEPVIERLTLSGTAAMRARGRKLLARFRGEVNQ